MDRSRTGTREIATAKDLQRLPAARNHSTPNTQGETMKNSNDYERFLEAKGVRLFEPLGIQEIALAREDALIAIELLRKAAIPILGGDVYLQRSAVLDHSFTSWSTNFLPNETNDSYLTRSLTDAKKFIRELHAVRGATPLFVFVIRDQ